VIASSVLVRAAELFNRKLYFECHDVLEDEWSGAHGEERRLLNALIHAAVGMYHLTAGNYAGASSQLEQAVNGLEAFRENALGVDVALLVPALERCLSKVIRGRSGEDVVWAADDVPVLAPVPAPVPANDAKRGVNA